MLRSAYRGRGWRHGEGSLTAVLGTAVTAAIAIGQGWAHAITSEVYAVALAIGYYVWGGATLTGER